MLPLTTTQIHQLAAAADVAVNTSLDHGGPRSPRPHGEVSAVRSLTLDGFDAIAHAWEPLLRPLFLRLELTAVFTHSRPQVRFVPNRYTKGTGRCELADLLIVLDMRDHTGTIGDRRAALVQAKRLKEDRIKLSGSDWTQHELLLDLPTFTFVDPVYAPHPRSLGTIPHVGDSGYTTEYGGVEVDGTPRHWTFRLPCAPNRLVAPLPLGAWLARMAAGLAKTGREAVAHGRDDWSFLVDELLSVTGALPIRAKQPTVLRTNPNVIGLIADLAAYLSVPPGLSAGGGPRKPEFEDYWPEGPISTVHLTFRQMG